MDNSNLKKYALLGAAAVVLVLGIIWIISLLSSNGSYSTSPQNYPESVQKVINNPVQKFDDWSTLVDREYYQISYSKNIFFITINTSPVVVISKQAEKDFLATLGIDEEYACTLPVIINVPSKVDEKASGYDFGMSFCPNRIHVSDKASS